MSTQLVPGQEKTVSFNTGNSYRFDVKDDGTWDNRKTFAFVDSGVPDGMSILPFRRSYGNPNICSLQTGVHCDSKGYVYAGCGDGVNVWNPAGTLIGKIYLGTTTANFKLVGDGRLVICAETKLFYATLANSTQPTQVEGQ